MVNYLNFMCKFIHDQYVGVQNIQPITHLYQLDIIFIQWVQQPCKQWKADHIDQCFKPQTFCWIGIIQPHYSRLSTLFHVIKHFVDGSRPLNTIEIIAVCAAVVLSVIIASITVLLVMCIKRKTGSTKNTEKLVSLSFTFLLLLTLTTASKVLHRVSPQPTAVYGLDQWTSLFLCLEHFLLI
mgnify:FL=1